MIKKKGYQLCFKKIGPRYYRNETKLLGKAIDSSFGDLQNVSIINKLHI